MVFSGGVAFHLLLVAPFSVLGDGEASGFNNHTNLYPEPVPGQALNQTKPNLHT